MSFRLHPLFLLAALTGVLNLGGSSVGWASAAASAQLQASTDQTAALLSGQAARLSSPPRLVQGRTLLPLLEVAALLDQPVSQQARCCGWAA